MRCLPARRPQKPLGSATTWRQRLTSSTPCCRTPTAPTTEIRRNREPLVVEPERRIEAPAEERSNRTDDRTNSIRTGPGPRRRDWIHVARCPRGNPNNRCRRSPNPTEAAGIRLTGARVACDHVPTESATRCTASSREATRRRYVALPRAADRTRAGGPAPRLPRDSPSATASLRVAVGAQVTRRTSSSVSRHR